MLSASSNACDGGVPAPLAAIGAYGYLGVDLFFILSGYIISYVYFEALTLGRPRDFAVFLWHRLIRLFPVHAVVLAGLVALIAVARAKGISLNAAANWNFGDIPWNLLLLHAWGVLETATWNMPSWSISAEWFAYLLFPLAVMAARHVPRAAALPAAALMLLIATLVYQQAGWSIRDAWVGAPALLRVESEFLCGLFLYRALASAPRGWEIAGDVLAVAGLGGFVLLAERTPDDFVLIGCLAVLTFGVACNGPLVRRIAGSGLLVWLGEVSYSTYLVHFPLILIAHRALDAAGWQLWSAAAQTGARVAIVVAVTAAAASLFYLVERPARRRSRDRFGRIGGGTRNLTPSDGTLRT
ncbi:MAG: acyltransferase [Xanthobacteraceae bacterium]|nr:acyltransferase [Xanthobacteraceae bacterium]